MGDFAADGTVVHTTDLNKILKLSSVGTATSGSPPAAGASSGYLEAFGTTVVTTNGSGGFAVNFTTAFPNGLAVVIPIGGDNTLPNITITLIQSSKSKTGFQGIAYSAGTAINTQSIRVDYLARGF